MRNIIVSMILLFIEQMSWAQTITGVVKDTANSPISYATVVLYSLPDTTYVSGAITSREGQFKLTAVESKQLLLQVSSIGYKTRYLPATTDQTIVLEQDVVSIDEVVVKGTRPISRLISGGVQINVANTVLSGIGTGNDVLKRIPMITGDNGRFKVFGRGDARVYINNREVRDPSELDKLNSADIERVEVISDPGARYDATVAAVINIQTAQKPGEGFSFNARSSFYTGENNDYINQISANYRKEGLDVFANLYYSNISSLLKGDISQIVDVDTLWCQSSYTNGGMRSNALNGTVGFNYEINENHYIGLRYDLKTSPQKNTKDIYLTSDIYADGVLYDKWKNRELKRTANRQVSQVNLYYAGQLGNLSVDFNADYYCGGTDTEGMHVEMSEEFGERTLYSTSHIDNSLLAGKLQLAYRIGKGKLSVGSEYVDISRNDEYSNKDLPGFTSKVNVDETNLALFTEYKVLTNIGNFSIGLRYEDANYDYLVDDEVADDKSRHYRQWFPNAFYATKIDKVELQLSYTSKVVRPSYRELSGNLAYGNRFMIETGYPFLKPTVRQDLSLMIVWKIVQASVRYVHQKNAIVTWIDRFESDPKVSVLTSRNLHELPKLAAMIAIAPTFGIWKPQLSYGIHKQWLDLTSYGINVRLDKPSFFGSFNNTFDLSGNFMINLDAAYNSKGHLSTSYIYKDSFLVDCSISKSFFDKSLQVKLAISDIFNQNRAINEIMMPQTDLKNLYHFDNRALSFTVRYYFNSARSKYKGDAAGADALNRF